MSNPKANKLIVKWIRVANRRIMRQEELLNWVMILQQLIIDTIRRMDCKTVKQLSCIGYRFNPTDSTIFYLTHSNNRYMILQQNLYTNLLSMQLNIPLKQNEIEAYNCNILYEQNLKYIVLLVGYKILIYSHTMRVLIYIGQIQVRNNIEIINRSIVYNKFLYFTINSNNIYTLSLQQCVKNQSLPILGKYKTKQNVTINDIILANHKLITVSNDSHIRIYDVVSNHQFKGILLENVGIPFCMHVSHGNKFLIIGTSAGYLQCYDMNTLGTNNRTIMQNRITTEEIRCVRWFHYMGIQISRRILVFAGDGTIKLYSFYIEQNTYKGQCNEIFYISRVNVQLYTMQCHNYNNFIIFAPGILLYMFDINNPQINYPIIHKLNCSRIQNYIPIGSDKEIQINPLWIYCHNLNVKTIREDICDIIDLKNVFDQNDIKIINITKIDVRPSLHSMNSYFIKNHIPPRPSKHTILLTYHYGLSRKTLILQNVDINSSDNKLITNRQYSGQIVTFIGPVYNEKSLLLVLDEEGKAISVMNPYNNNAYDIGYLRMIEIMDPQLRLLLHKYQMKMPPIIETIDIKIKFQRVHHTPFRRGYVVLYQSDNLLRFSRNVDPDHQFIDYNVFMGCSLRLEYNDIIIEIKWIQNNNNNLGSILCIDKVLFITPQLKIIKSVPIQNYPIQSIFVGYTLIVTTKIDVVYITLNGNALQLYNIENYQNLYLIVDITPDRIIDVLKTNLFRHNHLSQIHGQQTAYADKISIKCRYFNLLEPLLAGYIAYSKYYQLLIDENKLKLCIECYPQPYIVTQQFLRLLNSVNLTYLTNYFISLSPKLYSKKIKCQTLQKQYNFFKYINNQLKCSQKQILQLLLFYIQNHQSNDQYLIMKSKTTLNKLENIIGSLSLQSIQNVIKQHTATHHICNGFGDSKIKLIFYQNKQNVFNKMAIAPFQAENIGQWLGHYGNFFQSHVVHEHSQKDNTEEQQQEAEDQNDQFRHLVCYYRFDEGKGDAVEDISNFGNDGVIMQGDKPETTWVPLQEDPMQLEDKWGKKCSPQFAIRNNCVMKEKKLNLKGRQIRQYTVSIWLHIVKLMGSLTLISLKSKNNNMKFTIEAKGNGYKFMLLLKDKGMLLQKTNQGDRQLVQDKWCHICLSSKNHEAQNNINLYIDGELYSSKVRQVHTIANVEEMRILQGEGQYQYTQFRLWKQAIDIEQIINNIRMPLEIVYEKRKKMKLKLKKDKDKNKNQSLQFNTFTL